MRAGAAPYDDAVRAGRAPVDAKLAAMPGGATAAVRPAVPGVLVEIVRARTPGRRGPPLLVGLGGGVAAGKSTTAAGLADALTPLTVAVIATDGFLLPNRELRARGLLERKGFPDTYDHDAVVATLAALRAGGSDVAVPLYSHDTYDVTGECALVAPADVVVLEGLHALRYTPHLDLTVYLDAPEAVLAAWYVERFVELARAARSNPTSFYAGFAGMDDAHVEAVARRVWDAVNVPNVRMHVAPTRALADVVVVQRADHTVERVEVHDRAR